MIKKNSNILVVLTILSFAILTFASDTYQWKPAGTEKGCQLFISKVQGKEYIAAKASCVMNAGIEVVGEVLRDIENYPKWMEGCVETKMLKVYDPENDGFIFWYRQAIPFMIDRDMVLKCNVNMDFENARSVVTTVLTNEISYNSGKGYIRMPTFSSVWILEYIDNEHTSVTFMIDPHLGNGLPASVANPMIKDMPYKTLLKMIKMTNLPAYIEKGKSSRYAKLRK